MPVLTFYSRVLESLKEKLLTGIKRGGLVDCKDVRFKMQCFYENWSTNL